MNLEKWNALKQPPVDALKTIRGGRLSGFSDINPQWRYKVMTEQFGPCGLGWKYTIDRLWTEEGSEDQVLAFALVSVYIKDGDKWSDPIPGQGGSMLVEKEKSGLHSSDEGYKMAITDALGTALKMLGVAADIYMGRFDGTKYKEERPVIGYQELVDSIEKTTSMEALHKAFTDAWVMVKNDPAGQKLIAGAKDKKKKEFSNEA